MRLPWPRPRYACTSVGGHMYFGRGTHVPRSGYDDNEAFLRRLSGEKEKTKHVKRENKPCEKEKQIMWKGKDQPLALFLKTIETIETIFFMWKGEAQPACVVFKDNRGNLFYFWTLAFVIWNLKQASPKAANIHNRWLSCRRQRSLRSPWMRKIVLVLL